MPVHDTLLIGPRHLISCTDAANVAALFRLLRYPVPNIVHPLSNEILPLSSALRDRVKEHYQLASISSRGGESLTVTLFVLHADDDRAAVTASIRAISQAWMRKSTGYHLLVFASPGSQPGENVQEFAQLAFINPRRLTEGTQIRIKLHKLLVDRANPTRHDILTLNALGILARRFRRKTYSTINAMRSMSNRSPKRFTTNTRPISIGSSLASSRIILVWHWSTMPINCMLLRSAFLGD